MASQTKLACHTLSSYYLPEQRNTPETFGCYHVFIKGQEQADECRSISHFVEQRG
jgi:hypothetical protein